MAEVTQNRVYPKVPDTVKAELLRIGGTNDYDEPKLHLVWGEEATWFRADKWRLKYPTSQKLRCIKGWNVIDTSKKKRGEYRRYFTEKRPLVLPHLMVAPVYEDRELGFKGWVLEEWWPPEIVCVNYDANRWHLVKNDLGQVVKKIDLLGPPPIRGEYRFLMYCEDEKGLPMSVGDHRIIEIIEKAYKLREDEGAADGWRGMQSPEKALQLQKRLQEDRDHADAALAKERDDFIDDMVKGYARKIRHAVLS
jgi:hypothetical protein